MNLFINKINEVSDLISAWLLSSLTSWVFPKEDLSDLLEHSIQKIGSKWKCFLKNKCRKIILHTIMCFCDMKTKNFCVPVFMNSNSNWRPLITDWDSPVSRAPGNNWLTKIHIDNKQSQTQLFPGSSVSRCTAETPPGRVKLSSREQETT